MFLSEKLEGFAKFGRTLVYIFVATFPFLLYAGFIFTGTSTRSMNLILVVEILAVAFGVSLLKKDAKLGFLKSPIALSLFALFVVMFLSSILGVDFAISFWSKVTRASGLYYFIHLGFFFFFISTFFKDAVHTRTLIKTVIISSAIFSVLAAFGKEGFGLLYVNKGWAGFTFGNSSFAAMYLYGAFMLSLFYLFTTEKAKRIWWRFLIPVLLIFNPYFINFGWLNGQAASGETLVGAAKASSYALIVSLIILLAVLCISKIKSTKVRKGFLFGGTAVGLLVAIFAVHSFLSPLGFIQKKYMQEASGARPLVWELSQKGIAERPLLGFGVDNFQAVYERYYDNHVMEKVNGAEAWFDRAHNVFIDELVEIGYVGMAFYILAYLAIIGSMLFVLLKSTRRDHQVYAVVTLAYVIGHIMELQTAFDTTISYVILAIIIALASNVFVQTGESVRPGKSIFMLPNWSRYALSVGTVVVFLGMFFVGTIPIVRAQLANGSVRTVGSSEGRFPLYTPLFQSPFDQAGFLNRTAADLIRGISMDPKLLADAKKVDGFKKEIEIFTEKYEAYIKDHPSEYRVTMSLAHLYIYERLFDVDRLNDALVLTDNLIAMNPNIPQAYWQKAVIYLYQGKFELAREWARKGLEINPLIEESQNVVKYINASIKTFPEIDFYNFSML
jgi:O-antigen ligase